MSTTETELKFDTVRRRFTGRHSAILTGDIERLLPQWPQNFFQLIITSPPYNLGKQYEQKQSLNGYLEQQKTVIRQLVRCLKPSGSLCWQVGNFVDRGEVFPLDIYFYPLFKELGLKLRNRVVWHFNHGLHASHRLSGRYETLLWFTKGDDYVFNLDNIRVPSKYPGKRHFKGAKKGLLSGNPKGKNPSDYWALLQNEFNLGVIDVPNVKANHPEKTLHPCQFPIELAERCVLAFTNKGDWILDPYGGVGSSLLAGLKNERRGVSVDKEPSYSRIAIDRVQQLRRGQLKTRPLGKPIHIPSGREKITQMPQEWLK